MKHEKTIIGIVCAIVILLMQVTVWPGHDVGELREALMVGFGILSFAYLFAVGKVDIKKILIMAPLSWVIVRGLAGYVPGYTNYQMVKYFAMLGLMFIVADSDCKWVWRALVLMILIQAAYTFLPMQKLYGMPQMWGDSFANLKTEHNLLLYGFGTVRHRIRFATIIFVGVIACIQIITNKEENPWWKGTAISVGLLGLFLLWYSFSNMILVCCVLTAIVLIAVKKPKSAGLLFCFVGAIGMLLILGEKFGFVIDDSRKIMWKVALSCSFDGFKHAMIGHGIESWTLMVGMLPQVNNVGHPHNEYLKLLFENGLIGMLCFLSSFLLTVLFAERKLIVSIGLGMILFSFFTNCMTGYIDMFSITAIMGGLFLGDKKL